jgi:hypothetical protein
MLKLGTFKSKRWGGVLVLAGKYGAVSGPTAIVLQTDNGEPLTTLSVNMYRPECSHDSSDLPADCFYVKQWGGNEDLAQEALASGIFKQRDDMPEASSGFVTAPVWQINQIQHHRHEH